MHPRHYNNEGKPSALAARNGPYGKGSIAFIALMEQWRAAGDMAGLEVDRGRRPGRASIPARAPHPKNTRHINRPGIRVRIPASTRPPK